MIVMISTHFKMYKGEISYASMILKLSEEPIILSAVIVADEKLIEHNL